MKTVVTRSIDGRTTLTDHGYVMTLISGNRRIAIARKSHHGPWILRFTGGCWIAPEARQPNAVGIVNKSFNLLCCPNKAAARAEMKGLL